MAKAVISSTQHSESAHNTLLMPGWGERGGEGRGSFKLLLHNTPGIGGAKVQVTGHRLQVTGHRLQVTGHRSKNETFGGHVLRPKMMNKACCG